MSWLSCLWIWSEAPERRHLLLESSPTNRFPPPHTVLTAPQPRTRPFSHLATLLGHPQPHASDQAHSQASHHSTASSRPLSVIEYAEIRYEQGREDRKEERARRRAAEAKRQHDLSHAYGSRMCRLDSRSSQPTTPTFIDNPARPPSSLSSVSTSTRNHGSVVDRDRERDCPGHGRHSSLDILQFVPQEDPGQTPRPAQSAYILPSPAATYASRRTVSSPTVPLSEAVYSPATAPEVVEPPVGTWASGHSTPVYTCSPGASGVNMPALTSSPSMPPLNHLRSDSSITTLNTLVSPSMVVNALSADEKYHDHQHRSSSRSGDCRGARGSMSSTTSDSNYGLGYDTHGESDGYPFPDVDYDHPSQGRVVHKTIGLAGLSKHSHQHPHGSSKRRKHGRSGGKRVRFPPVAAVYCEKKNVDDKA